MPRYLLQGRQGGSCCTLVAVLNAARYHGIRSTRVGTPRWERFVDIARCRYGAALSTIDHVAEELGLCRRPIRFGLKTFTKCLPVETAVENPHSGTHMHAILITSIKNDLLEVINYRWITGPTVEWITWKDLSLFRNPRHTGHWAFTIQPIA
jgi:hypothetical protein